MMVRCPFVYADGKHCPGHVVEIKQFDVGGGRDKGEIWWRYDGEVWTYGGQSRERGPVSHLHVFCSDKGNHAGIREDALKFWPQDLPTELLRAMKSAECEDAS